MGKKTPEAKIIKGALQQVNPNNGTAARAIAAAGRFPVTAVAKTLGGARSGLAASARAAPHRRRSRPPMPENDLLARILDLIAELPTYGYRRVHTLLRQQAELEGWPSRTTNALVGPPGLGPMAPIRAELRIARADGAK